MLLNIDGRIFNVIVSIQLHLPIGSYQRAAFQGGKALGAENPEGGKGRPRKRDVKITMPGSVVEVLASPGDEVREGQPVLVLEAMKMQNELKSPQAGQPVPDRFPGRRICRGGLRPFHRRIIS